MHSLSFSLISYRDPEKIKQEKKANKRRFATTVTGSVRNANRPSGNANGGSAGFGGGNRFMKLLSNSKAMNTSEFDSGLPVIKKKKV